MFSTKKYSGSHMERGDKRKDVTRELVEEEGTNFASSMFFCFVLFCVGFGGGSRISNVYRAAYPKSATRKWRSTEASPVR